MKKMMKCILSLLMILGIAGCEKKVEEEVLEEFDKNIEVKLTMARYEGTREVYVEKVYDAVRLHITDEDGTQYLYRVSLSLLKEIEDLVQDINTETNGVSMKYRVDGREKNIKLNEENDKAFNDIISIYAVDNYEIKPKEVTIHGKKYKTVRGTGNFVGTGALIDFNGENWWEVEGYVGHYELTEKAKKEYPDENMLDAEVILDINKDGSLVLVIDGETFTEQASSERRYGTQAEFSGLYYVYFADEKENFISVTREGLPYPEDREPFTFVLERK